MLNEPESSASVTGAPKVSIVLTCYNLEKYIAAAIESVLSQDYSNMEVICVNDGSTDQSTAIIERYRDKIGIVIKQNGGHGSAISAGFEVCTGNIVIFFDGDDLLYPSCVTTVVKHWRPNLAICQYANEYVDAAGNVIDRKSVNVTEPYFANGNIREMVLRQGGFSHQITSGCAFAKDFLTKALPVPNSEAGLLPDLYLCCMAALYGDICGIQTVLFAQRLHGKNSSAIDKKNPLLLKTFSRRYEAGRAIQESIAKFAGSLGLVVSTPDPMFEPSSLKSMLVIRKLDPSYKFSTVETGREKPTRYFWQRIVVRALTSERLSLPKKLAYCLWASSVYFLPRKLAEKFIIATEAQNRTIFRSR